MRILVCVKQVPAALEVRLREDTRTVDRDAYERVTNPFDLYALEAAARLRDAYPGDASVAGEPAFRITALSMGPASAKSILRDALALCADDAYLVCDASFAGADVSATAHILARAVRYLEEKDGAFDLICTGARSTDGGTGVLAPMLAAHLGRPVLTDVLTVLPFPSVLQVTQEADTEDRTWNIETPCVLSFTKASYAVRYPDFARTIEAERTEIPVLDADALAVDVRSHTLVRKYHYHPVKKAGSLITGSPEKASEKLWTALAKKGVV